MPPFAHRVAWFIPYNFPGEVASFGDVRVDFAKMDPDGYGDGYKAGYFAQHDSKTVASNRF